MPNHLDDLVPGSLIRVDRVPYRCASRVPFDTRDDWVTLISSADPGTRAVHYRSALLSDLRDLADGGRLVVVAPPADPIHTNEGTPLAA